MAKRKSVKSLKKQRFLYSFFIGTLIAIWIILPTGIFVYLGVAASQAKLQTESLTWAPVTKNDQPVRREIGIEIVRSEEQLVVAPDWSGIVQETPLRSGNTLSSGEPIAVVGGILRVAYNSSRPFSTTLKTGDKGTEVSQLNDFLRDYGYSAPYSARFSGSTQSALRKFAASIGVPDSQHVTAFDPSWLVFIPQPTILIGNIDLQVGAPAPPAGTTITTVRPGITSAILTEAADATTGGSAPVPDGKEVDSGVDLPANSPPGTTSSVVAREKEELVLGTKKLPLNKHRDGIDANGFDDLQSQVDPDASIVRASLLETPNERAWVVPTAAVVTDLDGRLCTRVAEGTGHVSVSLTVLGTGPGVTVVDGDFADGQRVLISPPRSERNCG